MRGLAAFIVPSRRGSSRLAAVLLATLLAACAATEGNRRESSPAAMPPPERMVIITVPDRPEARQGAGSTARPDYRYRGAYAASDRAQAVTASIAHDHALREVTAWAIDPLRAHCVVYEIAAGSDRDAVVAGLARDGRVSLVQPFNTFETLSGTKHYNDPYLHLQRGFIEIDAASAQTLSRGEGVTVAVVDTSVDAAHPDLAGRVTVQRDFAPANNRGRIGESHGTQVAGVIAAGANNGIGVVGVAPRAELLSLRACWARPDGSGGSRCNSVSLAQALTAAINIDADIINLSLGGPRDPLLESLVEYAMLRGAIVVGAVQPGGRLEGFPAAMPGVIAVDSVKPGAPSAKILTAPGRNVLTLAPGGGYDFASGSSLATAHVTGSIALLKSLDRKLTAAAARELLNRDRRSDGLINVCKAAGHLRATDACTAAPIQAP